METAAARRALTADMVRPRFLSAASRFCSATARTRHHRRFDEARPEFGKDRTLPRPSHKSGRLIGLQNQNRTWHIAKDMLRVRTKGQPRQPVVMMGRDNDQVDVSFLCHVDDFFTRHTFTKLAVAVCVLLPYIF